MNGWIKIFRQITSSSIACDDHLFSRWIKMLLFVNHENRKIIINSNEILINPGQSTKSYKAWSKIFNCSETTAKRTIDLFQDLKMLQKITIGSGNRRKLLITIENWQYFQISETKTDRSQIKTGQEIEGDKNEILDRSQKNDVFLAKSVDRSNNLNYNNLQGNFKNYEVETDRSQSHTGQGIQSSKMQKNSPNKNILYNIIDKNILCRNSSSSDLEGNIFSFKKLNEKKNIISHKVVKNKNYSKEDIDKIYNAYPSTCFSNKSRRLKSRKKDTEKIEKILRSNEYSTERLLLIIEKYTESCKPTDNYREFIPVLKNFSTFLNNIPDYSDKELNLISSDEVLSEEFVKGCEMTSEMLSVFDELDMILCDRYTLDNEFYDTKFVPVNEILQQTEGFKYKFGADSLTEKNIKLR